MYFSTSFSSSFCLIISLSLSLLKEIEFIFHKSFLFLFSRAPKNKKMIPSKSSRMIQQQSLLVVVLFLTTLVALQTILPNSNKNNVAGAVVVEALSMSSLSMSSLSSPSLSSSMFQTPRWLSDNTNLAHQERKQSMKSKTLESGMLWNQWPLTLPGKNFGPNHHRTNPGAKIRGSLNNQFPLVIPGFNNYGRVSIPGQALEAVPLPSLYIDDYNYENHDDDADDFFFALPSTFTTTRSPFSVYDGHDSIDDYYYDDHEHERYLGAFDNHVERRNSNTHRLSALSMANNNNGGGGGTPPFGNTNNNNGGGGGTPSFGNNNNNGGGGGTPSFGNNNNNGGGGGTPPFSSSPSKWSPSSNSDGPPRRGGVRNNNNDNPFDNQQQQQNSNNNDNNAPFGGSSSSSSSSSPPKWSPSSFNSDGPPRRGGAGNNNNNNPFDNQQQQNNNNYNSNNDFNKRNNNGDDFDDDYDETGGRQQQPGSNRFNTVGGVRSVSGTNFSRSGGSMQDQNRQDSQREGRSGRMDEFNAEPQGYNNNDFYPSADNYSQPREGRDGRYQQQDNFSSRDDYDGGRGGGRRQQQQQQGGPPYSQDTRYSSLEDPSSDSSVSSYGAGNFDSFSSSSRGGGRRNSVRSDNDFDERTNDYDNDFYSMNGNVVDNRSRGSQGSYRGSGGLTRYNQDRNTSRGGRTQRTSSSRGDRVQGYNSHKINDDPYYGGGGRGSVGNRDRDNNFDDYIDSDYSSESPLYNHEGKRVRKFDKNWDRSEPFYDDSLLEDNNDPLRIQQNKRRRDGRDVANGKPLMRYDPQYDSGTGLYDEAALYGGGVKSTRNYSPGYNGGGDPSDINNINRRSGRSLPRPGREDSRYTDDDYRMNDDYDRGGGGRGSPRTSLLRDRAGSRSDASAVEYYNGNNHGQDVRGDDSMERFRQGKDVSKGNLYNVESGTTASNKRRNVMNRNNNSNMGNRNRSSSSSSLSSSRRGRDDRRNDSDYGRNSSGGTPFGNGRQQEQRRQQRRGGPGGSNVTSSSPSRRQSRSSNNYGGGGVNGPSRNGDRRSPGPNRGDRSLSLDDLSEQSNGIL